MSSKWAKMAAVCLLAAGILSGTARAQTAPATAVGSTSTTQTVTVTIKTAGTTNATLGTAIQVLTQGLTGYDFAYVSGGTCAANTAYAVNATCTVQFTFAPLAPGMRLGAVELFTAVGTEPIATAYIYGVGNGPLAAYTPGIISTIAGQTNGTQFGFSGDGGAATGARFFSLVDVAADASGNLYLSDANNNRIRKITSGMINTVAGGAAATTIGHACASGGGTATDTVGDGCPATTAQLIFPEAAAIDGAGNLYIADGNSNRIRKVSAATGVITTVAGGGSATTSGNACASGGGTATDTVGDGCQAALALLAAPDGIAIDGAGNLYIADLSNQRIRKVSATSGIITSVAGNGTAGYTGDGGQATSAEIAYPYMGLDSAGNLYISQGTHALTSYIRKVTTAGVISTIVGGGTATFYRGKRLPRYAR